MHKIILDTDPGIDDAFTLNLAIKHPEIDLVGITTVFGNVHVETATENALHLAEFFGNPNIPVSEGAAKPYKRDTHLVADFVHGSDGLGNTGGLVNKSVNTKKIDLKKLIVYGRSLGSGPSCYLAEKYEIGGYYISFYNHFID